MGAISQHDRATSAGGRRSAHPAPAAPRSPGTGDPLGVVDQLPGAVLLLDLAGRVVHLNAIAELRLDLLRPDVVGRDLFRDIFPELEADGTGARYRAAAATGRVSLAGEVSFVRQSGPGQLALGIRSWAHQGEAGAVVLLEDRSALAGEAARRRRAEGLAAVGELATGVAHEVNNPLASIKGFAQLLARDAATESEAQGLEIISQECTRAARSIDRLLHFAAHQRRRSPEPVELSALAEEVVELRRYVLETAGIEVERELRAALPAVRGDRGALQRAALALLLQAERSAEAGAEPVSRVVVRTHDSAEGPVLEVSAIGPAIPAERLRALLGAVGVDEQENGLGLASAREIAREHGGRLWAESVEGEGTTFFLRPPPLDAPGAATAAPDLPAQPHRPPARPLSVLVVDDEATLRLAVALFLSRRGHDVAQAADAREAHRLALARPFDAALVDARLSDDGSALLERLEALPGMKGRTILMGDAGAAPDCARPRLPKPFDMSDVLRLVETVAR